MERERQFKSDMYQITIPKPSENTPFPNFSKPTIAGCFSLNAERKYMEGPVYLKFCRMPKHVHSRISVKYDLNDRVDTEKSEEDADAQHQQTSELVHILEWIRRHKERFLRWRPNFVLYRGLMSKILNTPYSHQERNIENWKIAAMYKNGTIYLRNLDTQEYIENQKKFLSNPFLKRTAAWGYSFENFLLSDSPYTNPDPSKINKEECNIVFQAKIGSHDLAYAAEIDGVIVNDGIDANPKKNPELLHSSKLVELKTTRQFPHPDEMPYNFRRSNLRKWWIQSFTTGVSEVLVGFRDDEGVVHELQSFPLSALPKMGLQWSSTVCFNFLDRFLSEVRRIVGKDEASVYLFEYQPRLSRDNISILVTVEKNSDKLLPNLM